MNTLFTTTTMYKLINKDVIFQFLGDNPELIKPMMEMVLNNNILDLKDLDQFYDKGNFDEVKLKCHKAKSAMGYVGSSQTKKLLQSIEVDVKENYPNYKDELKEHITILEEELKQFLGELKDG
ncbi:Hpt domain-containing protein [Echinicola shivajiensis]|uniref:Hpt domain-containing protein n=1 Tax=Echinicola shivajiensis TaxID=1035916 RepID=UPI001FE6E1D7|nr:hypothetical protein [Echinicola shivajiensis]